MIRIQCPISKVRCRWPSLAKRNWTGQITLKNNPLLFVRRIQNLEQVPLRLKVTLLLPLLNKNPLPGCTEPIIVLLIMIHLKQEKPLRFCYYQKKMKQVVQSLVINVEFVQLDLETGARNCTCAHLAVQNCGACSSWLIVGVFCLIVYLHRSLYSSRSSLLFSQNQLLRRTAAVIYQTRVFFSYKLV